MLGWLFGKKKEVEELKKEVKDSFEKVKTDINNSGKWIKHLNEQDSNQNLCIDGLEDELSSIKDELEGMKNSIYMQEMANFKRPFKTNKQVFKKQTGVEGVQTPVQTPVQTGEIPNLSQFSVMERALIFVLLNTDMKLGYNDLAAMMGKERATIRGQINAIKRKSEGLIDEIIEKSGKKRVFVPNHIKEKLLEKAKVRVRGTEKSRKNRKKREAQ